MKRLYLVSVLDGIFVTALIYAFGSERFPLLPLMGVGVLIRPWLVLYQTQAPYTLAFDPEKPNSAAVLKEIAAIIENVKVQSESTAILLTPVFRENGFLPYELSYNPKLMRLTLSFDENTVSKKVHGKITVATQMPIRVNKDPVRLELNIMKHGGVEILRRQPLMRIDFRRVRHYETGHLFMKAHIIALLILYGSIPHDSGLTPLRLLFLAVFPMVFHKLYALRFRIGKFIVENFDFLLRLLRIRE